MSLITARTAPSDVPSSNALASIPDDLLDIPPAYLSLGSSPEPVADPPSRGDVVTYVVRVRCTEEAIGERTDGEVRHKRKLKVEAIWKQGERPPTADEDDQPPLFGTDGEADPEALGVLADKIVEHVANGVVRPAFSNLTGDRDE